ncbi:MAG: OmpA family protein [Thermodesulfobacteriota bacterium]
MDANGWLVTFSDLIMLLLTFFVMLLAMSSMNTEKLKDIHAELQASAGLLDYSDSRAIGSLKQFIHAFQENENRIVIDQETLATIFSSSQADKELRDAIKKLHEAINITDDERGIVVSLQEQILFNPGEATIQKDLFPVLDSIADAIASCPNDILIMGHTDAMPIQTDKYASNWELSSYRGLSVLGYFVEEKGLPPSRLSVGGYGPSRPLRSNDSPKNRSFNRRVEIIFRHV